MKTAGSESRTSSQLRATPTDLAELHSLAAKLIQQQLASDSYWKELGIKLRRLRNQFGARKKLQRLAKQFERKPVKLCQKVSGRHWLDGVGQGLVTRRQILALGRSLVKNPDVLTLGFLYPKYEVGEVLSLVKAFAAKLGGRPSAKVYEEALRIRNSGKYKKRVTHHICLDLVSGYPQMDWLKQSAERRKMNEGMKRHQRKLITKSPR